MSKKIRKFGCLLVFLSVVLAMVLIQPQVYAADVVVNIQVSPSTLNIQSSGGTYQWVHIHADIAYSNVATVLWSISDYDSTELTAPFAVFQDDQGNLVVKFSLEDVKGYLDVGVATVILWGTTKDQGSFSGEATIDVINVKGNL